MGRGSRARRLCDLVRLARGPADSRGADVHPALTPARALKALRAEFRFAPRKSLSQCFLTDPRALDGLAAAIAPAKGEVVIEIGPGCGFLTARLLDRGARVIAIEADGALLAPLRRYVGEAPGLEVIHADVLKTDLTRLLRDCGLDRAAIAGNLPYHVTSPILFHVLEHRDVASRVVCLVQREVADRMVAAPATADYGALSVAVAYAGTCERLFAVPPGAFVPRPGVASAAVRILPARTRLPPERERRLFAVVRAAFGRRRKTLLNALAPLSGGKTAARALLEGAGIDPNRRGETLSLEEFISLAVR